MVRIECESGVVVNRIIETSVNDKGRPLCGGEAGELLKEQKFRVEERIRSLEVSRQGKEGTHVFSEFEQGGKTRIMDPTYQEHPAWVVDVVTRLSSTEVAFRPLDITGVEFTIRIPTAESRLDPEYHEESQQTLPEPPGLNENTKAVAALIEE